VPIKRLEFVASARRELQELPRDVCAALGFDLFDVQLGWTPVNANQMHGLLRDAVELSRHAVGGTYRLVYTVRIGEAVYVLRAFQEKSSHRIATPQRELQLIAARLNEARRLHGSRK
jgi:phage-related protein